MESRGNLQFSSIATVKKKEKKKKENHQRRATVQRQPYDAGPMSRRCLHVGHSGFCAITRTAHGGCMTCPHGIVMGAPLTMDPHPAHTVLAGAAAAAAAEEPEAVAAAAADDFGVPKHMVGSLPVFGADPALGLRFPLALDLASPPVAVAAALFATAATLLRRARSALINVTLVFAFERRSVACVLFLFDCASVMSAFSAISTHAVTFSCARRSTASDAAIFGAAFGAAFGAVFGIRICRGGEGGNTRTRWRCGWVVVWGGKRSSCEGGKSVG